MCERTSKMFESRPLLVLALGGHGLSRPGERGYTGQRAAIVDLADVLAELGETHRLLIVHGNAPQVGRLLLDGSDVADLDIHTAQTQGELGYLLSQAMPPPAVSLVTRVIVPALPGPAVKPIGPVLSEQPALPCRAVPGGWRLLVASPKPQDVIETTAIGGLLTKHHVVAGGGGGVPLTASGEPQNVVVDKDWVAAMLALRFQAGLLVFATDVDAVYRHFGEPRARAVSGLTVGQCAELLKAGLDAGSMGPKLASAVEFAESSGRRALVCSVQEIRSALQGRAGTSISR